MADEIVSIAVSIVFGNAARSAAPAQQLHIKVRADGGDTIRAVKQRVAEAAGGSITADDLMLSFGPNDRKMGRQYVADPTVNEDEIKLAQYSVLSWIKRFPHWTLSARLLPPTPPPPGTLSSLFDIYLKKENLCNL